MARELTAFVAIIAGWLAVAGLTYSLLGLLWATVATIPFVPFIFGIGREWYRARAE
ncbi:hypothetical protein [Halosegnis sp.]|uniref:hypothetical protein n=1 Tax=Halosegnis sp. TaxID=2864959 RepID=UPI0035D40D66